MNTLKLKKGFKQGPDGVVYDVDNLKAAIALQGMWRSLPFNGFVEGDVRYPEQSKEVTELYKSYSKGDISRSSYFDHPFVKEYNEVVKKYHDIHCRYVDYLKSINFFDKEKLTMHLCALSYILGKQHLKVYSVVPHVYAETKDINEYVKKKLFDLMKSHLCNRHHERAYTPLYRKHYMHTCTKYCFDKSPCTICEPFISLTKGGLYKFKLSLEDNREIAKDVLKKYEVNDISSAIDNYDNH